MIRVDQLQRRLFLARQLCIVFCIGVSFLVLFDVPSGHASALPAPAQGSYVSVTVPAPALDGRVLMEVYLPPGYPQRDVRYPVLYLLHGEPGSGPQMAASLRLNTVVSALINSRQIKPMLIVLPTDGPTVRTDTEWMNSVTDPRAQWGTFVSNDLVSFVDQHYAVCTARTATSIGGVSMGAFGAVNAAVNNLGIFGAVLSWSGYFVANTPKVDGPTGSASWRAASPLYSLTKFITQLKKTPLHISFYTGPADHFASENIAFSRLLAREHLPYRFALHRGPHGFILWRKYFVSELIWLSSAERC
ncbi:MAG TPA: alpha/beta hydrolase-fold protein [Acidimicrobiales bacterium]|nr:alpha/beta hydrolase-fold protein [Acidimicrobiales bacterium]